MEKSIPFWKMESVTGTRKCYGYWLMVKNKLKKKTMISKNFWPECNLDLPICFKGISNRQYYFLYFKTIGWKFHSQLTLHFERMVLQIRGIKKNYGGSSLFYYSHFLILFLFIKRLFFAFIFHKFITFENILTYNTFNIRSVLNITGVQM